MAFLPPDICQYCRRTEIDTAIGAEAVEFDDAPPIGYSAINICADCNLILRYAIRIGALALRRELESQRQLDLFEGPKDRVIRRLMSLEGKDAPTAT